MTRGYVSRVRRGAGRARGAGAEVLGDVYVKIRVQTRVERDVRDRVSQSRAGRVHRGSFILERIACVTRKEGGGFYVQFSEARQVEASHVRDVRSTYPVIKATTTMKMS